MPGADKKAWWLCAKTHEWLATVGSRSRGSGCPKCAGLLVTPATCLAARLPELAAQWHPTRNGSLTPNDVMPRSGKKAWWLCANGHSWQAIVASRATGVGCELCTGRWSVEQIRLFVAALKDHLPALTPAELYTLFQQNGLLQAKGRGKAFVKTLVTGKFPQQELAKFVAGEPSQVDTFISSNDQPLESDATLATLAGSGLDDSLDVTVDEVFPPEATPDLPLVSTREALAALDHIVSSADAEAVEFFINSALTKLWKYAFENEAEAAAQVQQTRGNEYVERCRDRFLAEYQQAKDLVLPDGYAFHVAGQPTQPFLMQRLIAVRMRDQKRVGNWSGPGAGKTLSAVLASRVAGAGLTVVCCPNPVIETWREEILNIFPDSLVQTKTFMPAWADADGLGSDTPRGRYLILNYEAFQQPDSAHRVRTLVDQPIDCIIVDELHLTKQRNEKIMSQRRKLVSALVMGATAHNPDLRVLGMSGTPVINSLQEGKSLVELLTGVVHADLDTTLTVGNCMKLHQRLLTLGIRWLPRFASPDTITLDVDCADFLDDIRYHHGVLELEQILTRARLPAILASLRPKTLIYTHNISGIDRILADAVSAAGWTVGFFTGEDKTGWNSFVRGDTEVLIGSSAIGTGVDGLQSVCSRLIVNVLPWTAAEFDQLTGRIVRTGQTQPVSVVLPLTYADVNGERWSWCQSKMERLVFKRSVADAAVDGVVPEGHLRTSEQAHRDLMAWLARLDNGVVQTVERRRIVVPLTDDPAAVTQRRYRYGDFAVMNNRWKATSSATTHARLQANPEEWAQYHTLYRRARQDWATVPYQEMIRWCQRRSGLVIGDFGCGEAFLAAALSDQHTVHSFDHVAINPSVVACDLANVPLGGNMLDVAVFSLALMGANFTDYLREAHRTLKLDGQLHVIEASSRFSNREQFARSVASLGFEVVSVKDMWKFTHIRALKTEHQPATSDVRF